MDDYQKALKEKYEGQEQITESHINELETAFKDAERKLPYETVKSKVWKGRIAPQGKLFFGVKVKNPKTETTYTSVMLLDCAGKQDHLEQLLYANLYLLLNEKYKFEEDASYVESYKKDMEQKIKEDEARVQNS